MHAQQIGCDGASLERHHERVDMRRSLAVRGDVRGEHVSGGEAQRRPEHHHVNGLRGSWQRPDHLAASRNECDGAPAREEWDIRADGDAQMHEVEIAVPERREAAQHRGGVGRSSTEACRQRDALADAHERGGLATTRGGEGFHRASGEILRACEVRGVADLEPPRRRDAHVVCEVKRREDAAQLVVAVVALSRDREREIQLGRCAEADGPSHVALRARSRARPTRRGRAARAGAWDRSART